MSKFQELPFYWERQKNINKKKKYCLTNLTLWAEKAQIHQRSAQCFNNSDNAIWILYVEWWLWLFTCSLQSSQQQQHFLSHWAAVFGLVPFMLSTNHKRTQIYTDFKGLGEDGPSMCKMGTAPGCPIQVPLVNQHHRMKSSATRRTILLLHIFWKDSYHSLPLALGKATFTSYMHFPFKDFSWQSPWGSNFFFSQWNSSIPCATIIFSS